MSQSASGQAAGSGRQGPEGEADLQPRQQQRLEGCNTPSQHFGELIEALDQVPIIWMPPQVSKVCILSNCALTTVVMIIASIVSESLWVQQVTVVYIFVVRKFPPQNN